MTTSIRSAIVGDEAALISLNRFVQALHVDSRPDQFRAISTQDMAAWYRSRLEEPATRAWIAEDSGAPVGYLLAFLHERPETPFTMARHYCEIDQIAVDPTSRRRGVARALILRAIAGVQSEGIREIEAVWWSFNTGAHEMFRRLGFVQKTIRFELQGESQ